MISVIFPVFNEEDNLKELHERLVKTLSSIGEPFEIIAVDDGSSDRSREILVGLSPITAVMFSRNFGENAAVDAGLQKAIGDFIITIDSDLQSDPEDIVKIVEKLKEGYGAVIGWRRNRRDNFSRRLFSKLANLLVRKVTGAQIHDFGSSLKGYRREFIEGVHLLGETFVFMPIFAHNRGARVAEVEIAHQPRKRGNSKYHISNMIMVFFDLISVKFLLNYFSKPLRFFGMWALFFFSIATISFGVSIALKIMRIEDFSTTPLPLIGTMLMILSVLIFMIGFVTEILLRIYYEQKDNSQYMIYEVIKNK